MQPENNDDLFSRFKTAKDKDLENVISSIDGFDSESYENAERASNHHLNKSWNRLKSFLHKIAGYSILILTVVFFALLFRFVWDILQDSDQTKILLKDIWNAVLIATATLFVQHAVSRK